MSDYKPTDKEIAARNKRNIALAFALLTFVVIVFVTMISRGTAGT